MTFTPIEILNLGPVKLQVWGLLVAIGIAAGTFWALRRAKKQNIKPEHILNIVIIFIISGFIGARLLYVFENWDFYSNDLLRIFQVWNGGLSLYGGVILAIFSFWIYTKITKLNFWQIIDIFTPPLFLALSISRLGCFLVNDHLGKLTDLPWGIDFGALPRHPVSAYYVLACALIALALGIYSRLAKNAPGGILGALGIILYSVTRLLIDTFARDYGLSSLSTYNQIFLIILFSFGVFLVFYLKVNKGTENRKQ